MIRKILIVILVFKLTIALIVGLTVAVTLSAVRSVVNQAENFVTLENGYVTLGINGYELMNDVASDTRVLGIPFGWVITSISNSDWLTGTETHDNLSHMLQEISIVETIPINVLENIELRNGQEGFGIYIDLGTLGERYIGVPTLIEGAGFVTDAVHDIIGTVVEQIQGMIE